MKLSIRRISACLALTFVATFAAAQCDPNFDFGEATFDYYPNPDMSQSFVSGAINEFYADVFHFVLPSDAGEIDPLLGLLGLNVDSLTLVGLEVQQNGMDVNLNDIGIAITCNNLGILGLDCSFAPNMQYCIALEGTTIQSGNFELVFNFDIHADLIGIPSTFPVSLPAIELQILGYGCADETACNYEEFVIADNNTCIYGACSIVGACNYDSTAVCDDGSCVFAEDYYDCEGECLIDSDNDGICDELEILGCLDSLACNYNPDATEDSNDCFYETDIVDCDGECFNDADGDGVCDELEVLGCTDEIACNYDSLATDDDGSCVLLETYAISGETSVVQFNESEYTYPFNMGSDYVWEVTTGTIVTELDGSITVEWTADGLNELCVSETDSEGCSSAQVCLEVNVSLFIGIADSDEVTSRIGLFPVPADEFITLTGLEARAYTYEIYNAQGQMMHCAALNFPQNNRLNVETLPKGHYILRLTANGFAQSRRFHQIILTYP